MNFKLNKVFRIHNSIFTLTLLIISISLSANASENLAKSSQNPIADIISVPFENNSNFDTGPNDTYVNVLNIKPVIPVKLGKWNLINRPIIPIIYQEERFSGEGNKFGTGDINYQGFFSPSDVGNIIWVWDLPL